MILYPALEYLGPPEREGDVAKLPTSDLVLRCKGLGTPDTARVMRIADITPAVRGFPIA